MQGQFGMMIQLEINPDSSKIPVLSLQEKVRNIFLCNCSALLHCIITRVMHLTPPSLSTMAASLSLSPPSPSA